MSKNTNNDTVGGWAMAVGCGQALLGGVLKLHPSTHSLAVCLQYIGGATAVSGYGACMASDLLKPVFPLVDPTTMDGLHALAFMETVEADWKAEEVVGADAEATSSFFSALFNAAAEER